MNRLTEEKQIGAFASLKDKSETKIGAFSDYDCLFAHMTAVTKLKKYEDTGLEPEEIEEIKAIKWWSQCGTDDMLPTIWGIPINRLRELAEADRDEREVVHARWIPDPRQWSASQCSRCATPAPWKRGCANVQCLTPHCQNCGALMDLYGKDENGD